MVVLAPGQEIRPSDIPVDVREGGTRLLPVRVPPGPSREIQGQEFEFIYRSLVELKLQLEELRRRIDEAPQRVEVVDMGRAGAYDMGAESVLDLGEVGATGAVREQANTRVIYRPGMKMTDVERATIEAALEETGGNRRRAAERLGIGERTLYRKTKEYELV